MMRQSVMVVWALSLTSAPALSDFGNVSTGWADGKGAAVLGGFFSTGAAGKGRGFAS
nr:MAG TPA: hypothetical protein [Caudoviricetes sp.]DAT82329.1 MAG TPA: hypothetical protein [Caudoviricetes sp.]